MCLLDSRKKTKLAASSSSRSNPRSPLLDENSAVPQEHEAEAKRIRIKGEHSTGANNGVEEIAQSVTSVRKNGEDLEESGESSGLSDLGDQLSEQEKEPKRDLNGTTGKSAKGKRSRKQPKKNASVKEGSESEAEDGEEESPKKRRRPRKTKDAEPPMPLAARSTGIKTFVGSHVSAAKGVQNSVTNSVHVGGNAFALFLKSQRKWENPPLQDEHRDAFHLNIKTHKFDPSKHVIPHGSYLVNLAQVETSKADQAYNSFLEDLQRCEALGIRHYNFHPGNTNSNTRSEAITRIATHLNNAHASTTTVIPLLETMAGGGNVIGSTFADLASIISQVSDKARVGVCLDTCHVFAAGYDLRTPSTYKTVMQEFDEVIGIKYLKAFHMNDSKAPLGSHRDLHANIGTGFLGLRAFWNVMNDPRLEGLPLILETPVDRPNPDPEAPASKKTIEDPSVWAREIKLLESLTGMDADSEEFLKLEKELSKEGREERERIQEQVDRKRAEDEKKAKKAEEKEKKKALKEGGENQKGAFERFLTKGKGEGKTKAKGRRKGREPSDELSEESS